jgi:hypothetical protein
VIVSSQLDAGTLDLQIESDPCALMLHIYTAKKIEHVMCSGQEVKVQQVNPHHFIAEVKK